MFWTCSLCYEHVLNMFIMLWTYSEHIQFLNMFNCVLNKIRTCSEHNEHVQNMFKCSLCSEHVLNMFNCVLNMFWTCSEHVLILLCSEMFVSTYGFLFYIINNVNLKFMFHYRSRKYQTPTILRKMQILKKKILNSKILILSNSKIYKIKKYRIYLHRI